MAKNYTGQLLKVADTFSDCLEMILVNNFNIEFVRYFKQFFKESNLVFCILVTLEYETDSYFLLMFYARPQPIGNS